MNPLELTYPQLLQQFQVRYGRGKFHAAAVYRAFYGASNFDIGSIQAFSDSARLARQVHTDLHYHLPDIVRTQTQEGVTKLAFQFRDGHIVEAVIIPMPQHTTLCISSQVGCRIGCRFCETGQMGLKRNLTAAEIVAQVHRVKLGLEWDVRNVVFMGMGEPLDNFESVTRAIDIISDQRGLNIAKRRITLSTSGVADGIERLARLQWPQLKLAVSLNAANDRTRSALMPINRRYNLAVLKKALQAYPLARGNVLLMEYVLIKGVNDTAEDASQLAAYIEDMPVRVNLIAYNPRCRSPFDPPSREDVQRFHQMLLDQNIFVRLRRSKGADIQAACGQLGAEGAIFTGQSLI